MSLDLRRFDSIPVDQLSLLGQAFIQYYQSPPISYYKTAEYSTAYTASDVPFHWDLAHRVKPGMSVLEMGCGTAHLCPHVEQQGGKYSGMDFSDALIAENRRRFPNATFLKIGSSLTERFDLVASLYTIEHVVDPPAYLTSLWNNAKPGGMVAIICPEFVDCDSLPPSLFYGTTPRRLREKLRTAAGSDAFRHFFDLHAARAWKAAAIASAPGAFWINLRPRVLHGAQYSIDADAVHLARLKDLVWWFEKKGAGNRRNVEVALRRCLGRYKA